MLTISYVCYKYNKWVVTWERGKRAFWHVCPTKTHQSAHPRSLIWVCCPHGESLHPWLSKMHPKKILINCANAQTDLNIRCAHMSEGTFSDVAAHICTVRKCLRAYADSEGPDNPRSLITGPSLYANRIIWHYRMCQWRTNARMILCACVGWIWIWAFCACSKTSFCLTWPKP